MDRTDTKTLSSISISLNKHYVDKALLPGGENFGVIKILIPIERTRP